MNQQYPMQGLASLVASQGRGGDTDIVHMTPEEINSLQNIARAMGAQESDLYNPVTGAPQLGFLSNFLGSIWQGVQNVGRAAVENPQITSALIGTAYGAVKGDLQKGLEAGMAAYAGTKLLGGIAGGRDAAPKKTMGYTPEDIKAAKDYAKSVGLGEEAAQQFLSNIKPTVEQPLSTDVTGGLASIFGGGQGQGQGIFRTNDPIWNAIALYGAQRLE